MYVHVLRDKVTGLASAEISHFGLVDTGERDIMFRVSTVGLASAERLVKDLNLEMMVFGEPDINRVDRAVYAAVLMDKARLADANCAANEKIEAQAAIIRRQNVTISNLEAEIVDKCNHISDIKNMLTNIMNALALDTALERTHQQRNAAQRFIVRAIKRLLDSDGGNMDDIPF